MPGALSNQPPGNAQAPITNPQQPPARPGQTPQQQGAQQQTGAQAASGSLNERRDATTNYEVDRTISHVKQPVGALKRLSVAVVVNYIRDKDGDLKPLPPEELNKLTNLVREAMAIPKDAATRSIWSTASSTTVRPPCRCGAIRK